MAMPIMIGAFIQNIVMITDAIFVNRIGTIEFDAANNAGLLYVCLFMLSRGLGEGTQIQIAKEYGMQKYNEINHTLSNSFVIQFGLSIVLFIILFVLKDLFIKNIVASTAIQDNMIAFLNYRSWGIFFAGFQASIMAFFIGIGKTRIIIYSTIILAFSNIFLDYVLIFGELGFPEMGLEGAALASEGIAFLYLFYHLFNNKNFKEFNFKFKQKIVLYKTKIISKLSWPLMTKGFLSIFTWFIFFSLIEKMGENDLEASHVVRNLFFISFIPIFGFGDTTRTYVSYYVGRNEYEKIYLIQKKIILLSIAFFILFFHGAIFYPEFMVKVISNNPEILESSKNILQIVFGSMLLFAIVNIFYNTVAALGKTLLSLYIEIVAIVLYVLFGYLFIIQLKWTVVKIWLIEYIYFGTIGVLCVLYLMYYHYKIKKIK